MAYFDGNTRLKFFKKLIIPLFLLFICLSCSASNDLITRPPGFNPDSYINPAEYGIKNSTEFFKKSESSIESSEFVPPKVEGGIKELMKNVKFPYEARQQYQEGNVLLNLFIDQNGKVQFVQLLESPDRRLSKYSIMAVKNTSFLPATLNDNPVKATRMVMFVFNFRLDNDVNY